MHRANNAVIMQTEQLGRIETLVLNGGSASCPYDVNRIPLTSDPVPVALLSDPMIRIPLS